MSSVVFDAINERIDKVAMLARLCSRDQGIPAGRVTQRGAIVFTDQAANAPPPA